MGRPLIAVTTDSRTSYLKRLAFLFDQFLFVSPSLSSRRAETVGELRLADRFGLNVSVPNEDVAQSQDHAEFDWLRERGIVRNLGDTVPFQKMVAGLGPLSRLERAAMLRRGEEGLDLFLSLLSRGGAAALKQDNVDVVALTRSPAAFQLPAERSELVFSVVIENIPVAHESVSWEDLLAFKAEETAQVYHARLRQWIQQHANNEISVRELAGEIEAQTKEFEFFMSKHHVVKSMTTIELLIKAGAVGAIAGFGVSEQAAVVGAVGSILVTATKHRAELLQAEMQAPGAELAYMVKARERFGK